MDLIIEAIFSIIFIIAGFILLAVLSKKEKI